MSQPKPFAKTLEPFVCGGSAATFASIVIHPMDLAKVRMRRKTKASKKRTQSINRSNTFPLHP